MAMEIYNDLTLNSPFGIDLIPSDDLKRISELRKYNIVNTSAEIAFDNAAEIAAKTCQAPIGLISFIDLNSVFFKSAHNSPKYQQKTSDRGNTLCSIVIRNGELTTFLDTHDDPCLMANPEVRAKNGVRFYAGVPIRTKSGYDIGALAVVDTKPRTSFSAAEADILHKLAAIVVDELELRLAMKNLQNSIDTNLAVTSHELINPLNTILGFSQLIEDKPIDKETQSYINMIKQSANAMNDLLVRILESQKGSYIELIPERVNISTLLQSTIEEKAVLAHQKGQEISADIQANIEVDGDIIRMKEVFDNIIDNAIKYSPLNEGIIQVSAKSENQTAIVEIVDNGTGFDETDKQCLFQKFVKLSSKPTGNEKSNGLGLYITHQIITKHNGEIIVESDGKNKGAKIVIKFPLHQSKM